MARLVQPGKNGGWIGGTLSWGKLDSYGYFGGYPASQVRLLREMLALYRARDNQPYYYHSHGNERSIELSAFESGRLWPLLDEAGRAGLQLVYGHKLGAVERYREARLCLDVTQAEAGGELVIAAVIRVDSPEGEGEALSRSGSSAPRATASSTSTRPRHSGAPIPPAGVSAWPGSTGRFPRSCRRWRWPASGSRCPPPDGPSSATASTRGCGRWPR